MSAGIYAVGEIAGEPEYGLHSKTGHCAPQPEWYVDVRYEGLLERPVLSHDCWTTRCWISSV